MIVLVNGSVHDAIRLDPQNLSSLANWLCQEENSCDDFRQHGSSVGYARSLELAEKESQINGGYCDRCRDLAGRILGVFYVCPKETEPAQ